MSDELARLRSALRFYADRQHWETAVRSPYGNGYLVANGSRECDGRYGGLVRLSATECDRGDIARRALEGKD